MAKKVVVVLAGCGHIDGSEIREAVLTLLALDRAGAEFQCAAPDKPQMHVVDHRTRRPVPGEARNVLTERRFTHPRSQRKPTKFNGEMMAISVWPKNNWTCQTALVTRSRFLFECSQITEDRVCNEIF